MTSYDYYRRSIKFSKILRPVCIEKIAPESSNAGYFNDLDHWAVVKASSSFECAFEILVYLKFPQIDEFRKQLSKIQFCQTFRHR